MLTHQNAIIVASKYHVTTRLQAIFSMNNRRLKGVSHYPFCLCFKRQTSLKLICDENVFFLICVARPTKLFVFRSWLWVIICLPTADYNSLFNTKFRTLWVWIPSVYVEELDLYTLSSPILKYVLNIHLKCWVMIGKDCQVLACITLNVTNNRCLCY